MAASISSQGVCKALAVAWHCVLAGSIFHSFLGWWGGGRKSHTRSHTLLVQAELFGYNVTELYTYLKFVLLYLC